VGIGEGLDGLSGDACVEIAGLELHAFGDESASGNKRFVGDFGVVKDDASHADQDAVTDFAAVDDGAVADGNFTADFKGRFLIGAMENSAILDVRAVADADIMHIAPNDDMVPDAAGLADYHIADDDSGLGEEGVRSDLGDFSEERADDRHIQR